MRNSETEMADYPLNDIGWFYSFVFKRNEIIFNKDLYDKCLSHLAINFKLD